ncbi:hypothetical protein EK904_012623 [Melospiza melodia maxima]|nr:hypothetical protein EK904_012623 [Melospiza melodia maxima]
MTLHLAMCLCLYPHLAAFTMCKGTIPFSQCLPPVLRRLSGEGGKAFTADFRKHFPQLCKVFKAHISSPNLELSNAALQALGFCTFNSNNTAELSGTDVQELLAAVNSVALKCSDKNTRTRALWVISKQAFPPEIVRKEVSNILSTLETILTKGEVQSVVVEYEALNVIIRLMEQAPAQMGEEAVRWAKLIIPLVVHSSHKVQLRGATALEMGMPLLLQRQQEVAAVTEHLMTTKLISELQKLFSSKNETFVLKLWPLFVRLLGKTLHRSGSFINSLLQLEELGFRSSSPVVKKIAFIAWKSLIDNFALNPDILCSAKRLKLLMQPLSSIHVRTEALALTKLEVWWYLLMRLGPHLPSNFEQVCVPLIQSTLSVDPAAAFPGTPSRPNNPSLGSASPGQKPGTPRMALSSPAGAQLFPSIQLLAMEMLLHFLMGPHVVEFAKHNKLGLSLVLFNLSHLCSKGTPALFLIQLPFHNNLLESCVTDERFFGILQALVGFALSGPTSALAFSDSVLGVIEQSAGQVGSKEHLCRMWSIVVNPLTEWINQATLKSLLRSWSELYRAFARCAALVATAEENLCCEELCAKIMAGLEGETPVVFSMLEGLTHLVSVMVDCINFAPYGTKFQPKNRSPQTPTDWAKKKKEPLGKLSSLLKLLLLLLNWFHELSRGEQQAEPLLAPGLALLAALHSIISHISLPSLLGTTLGTFSQPLALFYEKNRLPEVPKVYSSLNSKLFLPGREQRCCLQQDLPFLPPMPGLCPVFPQVLYREELGTGTPIPVTPELERVRRNQEHLSSVLYKESVGTGTPTAVTPEMERVKRNQEICSSVLYKENIGKATPTPVTPEMERVKRNQEIISSVLTAGKVPKNRSGVSVLSQAKKKIPLLLPGFESVEVSEECSGPFSDLMENSQLDAKISGMEVKVGQKRDSILAQTSEAKSDGKDKPSNVQATPAKLKLEFPSPKTTSETLLEEEKSVDFVFIPPETKPRILTEHQKEVLRADIPAMYNNLDASQDTSSFCQYSQSQEDSLEMPPAVETAKEDPANQPQEENVGSEGSHSEESPACTSEEEAKNETAEMIPEETSIGEDMETSSPVSRRQSFVTLEKFGAAESRPFSPAPLGSVSELPGSPPEAGTRQSSSDSRAGAKAEKSGEEGRNPPKAEAAVPARRSSSGSQDREDGPPKRDRRKEEEKAGQKKLSQGKGDGSQKQKGIPGKTTESTKESSQPERAAEEWGSKDCPALRGLEEEPGRAGRRAEEAPRAEGEGTAGPKVERPRYHTRRSSQGLLASIENSEADSSEGKEESTRKKKPIKVRSRSNSLEGKLKEGQAGSQSPEGPAQGSETKSALEASKGEPELGTGAAVPAEPGGLEEQEIAAEAEGSGSSESPGALQDTSVEPNKAEASMESLGSPCEPEQDGRAAEERHSSTGDCAPAAHTPGAEPSSVQSPECHNKRSKRVKKIKSCDCCFKKPKLQVPESKLSESKMEKAELEEPEGTQTPAQTPVQNVSGPSDLEESLALAPCGMSTPLHPPEEPCTFSLGRQEMDVENLQGSTVGVEEQNPEDPEASAAETTESMEEIQEPAEQKEQTEQVLPESVPEEPRESCLDSGEQGEEPAAAEKEEIKENGELEEVPEELSVDSTPEEKEVKELEGNQEDKGEAENCAGETHVGADQEMKEELEENEIKVPESVAVAEPSVDSPLKGAGDAPGQVAESPTSLQARCTWSPSASPSTSILKRGVKRSQEDDSLSPANKIRRVSFANPIFQEGLADDIDRRSPVIRSHSSPSSRSLKILSNMQHITTPTKGFLSPGSRTLKFKSSKKCLITEMSKESLPCLSEFVYPALAGCKAPVDVILPQITSNIWSTVGDLSTLTALEIKTLPIRSPKVSNVKRALRGYHEQQVKSRVLEESTVLEDAEKPGNDVEEKSLSGDEEKLAADLVDAGSSSSSGSTSSGSSAEPPAVDLPGQVQALAAQLSSEGLGAYSGRQLLEMQEQLLGMAASIARSLRGRWPCPPPAGTPE